MPRPDPVIHPWTIDYLKVRVVRYPDGDVFLDGYFEGTGERWAIHQRYSPDVATSVLAFNLWQGLLMVEAQESAAALAQVGIEENVEASSLQPFPDETPRLW